MGSRCSAWTAHVRLLRLHALSGRLPDDAHRLGARTRAARTEGIGDPPRVREIAAHYAHQFDSTFTGLVASAVQLDSIKTAWSFAVEHEDMPGMKPEDYGVAHPAGVYFIDRAGLMRFVFAPGSKPAELASDLKLLM